MAPKTVREARQAHIQSIQAGTGKYLLRNRLNATLNLPKPSLDNPPIISVPPGAFFHGDSYHIKHLNTPNSLKVEVVQAQAEETSEKSQVDKLDRIVTYIDPADGVKKQKRYRDLYPEEAARIEAERAASASTDDDSRSSRPSGKGGKKAQSSKAPDEGSKEDEGGNDGIGD